MNLNILSLSAKLGDGRQKFILKESTEGISANQAPRTKYSAFAYQVDTSILAKYVGKCLKKIKFFAFVYQMCAYANNITKNTLFTQTDYLGLYGWMDGCM